MYVLAKLNLTNLSQLFGYVKVLQCQCTVHVKIFISVSF